jgi:isopentenyl diphosphate isomerase/L-lactate dehydrogenase-like FMN-dependent dehydrogenase
MHLRASNANGSLVVAVDSGSSGDVGKLLGVLFDGGVRRGSDIVKVLALGARAVMVGRPHLYGLGAAGEAGAVAAVELLTKTKTKTKATMGLRSIADEVDRASKRLIGSVAGGMAALCWPQFA